MIYFKEKSPREFWILRFENGREQIHYQKVDTKTPMFSQFNSELEGYPHFPIEVIHVKEVIDHSKEEIYAACANADYHVTEIIEGLIPKVEELSQGLRDDIRRRLVDSFYEGVNYQMDIQTGSTQDE